MATAKVWMWAMSAASMSLMATTTADGVEVIGWVRLTGVPGQVDGAAAATLVVTRPAFRADLMAVAAARMAAAGITRRLLRAGLTFGAKCYLGIG
jgi:hypothetical protein